MGTGHFGTLQTRHLQPRHMYKYKLGAQLKKWDFRTASVGLIFM